MATVVVPSVWPVGSRVSITGQVVAGDGHVAGASPGAQFGTPTATVPLVQIVSIVGCPTASRFGVPVMKLADQKFTVAGLGSAQQFSSVKANQIVHVAGFVPYPAAVPSITGAVITGDGHVVGGYGGPGWMFGRPTIYTIVRVTVGGVPSTALLGAVQIVQIVHPASVPSAQVFGTRIGIKFEQPGVPSAQAFGKPIVFLVWMRVFPCTDLDLEELVCIDLDLDEAPVTELDLQPLVCT